jgi:type II secretory ATPase GspE/PulE/Tfp pilus assembly ATPase PilB-like protein
MYTPSVSEMVAANVSPSVAAKLDGMAFYRKVGCPRCNQTGYKGRIGIYEFLSMSDELAAFAASKPSHEELRKRAIKMGMRTMWDEGMDKVAQGLTSIEELARVVAT